MPWALGAGGLSVGCGVALVAVPLVVLDAAIVIGAASAVAWLPFVGLIAVLGMNTFAPSDVFYVLLTIGACGLAVAVSGPRSIPTRVVVPLVLLLAVTLPWVPLHPSVDEGFREPRLTLPQTDIRYSGAISLELFRWLGLCSVAVILVLASWTVRTRERFERLVAAILVSAVYPVAIGLEQWAAGDLVVRAGAGSDFRAVRGPFDHPNYFAFYLLAIVAITVVALFESRSVTARGLLAGLLAASLACLFLTYTRSAWIGVAVTVLLLGALHYRALLAVGLLMLVVASLAFPSAADRAERRFGDLGGQSSGNSLNSWDWRTGQWKRMRQRGWDRPVLGHGYGSYERLTVEEFGETDPTYKVVDRRDPVGKPRGFSAHNDYVKLWVETGAIGLGLWILAMVGLIGIGAQARRVPALRGLGSGLIALVVALMAIGMADNVQGYTLVLMIVAALAGGTWGVTRFGLGGSAAGRPFDARLGPEDRPQDVAPA